MKLVTNMQYLHYAELAYNLQIFYF